MNDVKTNKIKNIYNENLLKPKWGKVEITNIYIKTKKCTTPYFSIRNNMLNINFGKSC